MKTKCPKFRTIIIKWDLGVNCKIWHVVTLELTEGQKSWWGRVSPRRDSDTLEAGGFEYFPSDFAGLLSSDANDYLKQTRNTVCMTGRRKTIKDCILPSILLGLTLGGGNVNDVARSWMTGATLPWVVKSKMASISQKQSKNKHKNPNIYNSYYNSGDWKTPTAKYLAACGCCRSSWSRRKARCDLHPRPTQARTFPRQERPCE